MDEIIVTVTDEKGSFFLDMELPAEQTIGSLTIDIIKTLNAYQDRFQFPERGMCIFSNRTRKLLRESDTLRSSGVWNGDYITLVFRRGY